MHPPDLKMLETNSGLHGSDGSFGGKAQATSSNSTLETLVQEQLFGEMHPPDLKMLETNSGLRGSDGSFGGKAQATGSNSTLVEAIEAAIGLNSEAAEVGGSKDSRAAADAVCGVNMASENMSQHSCGEHILVERGKNKQANVEVASGEIERWERRKQRR
ncbi:hypothetical protein F2Q68_00014235 [Brassica cretica]|uniref:Uncharacterized protein n=1 Tax=Brassica cretica TaxID=69181 RepID=A0A8S9HFX4_BRACR|nr:hypothetical protein F2Q68_00014235 [Brassica cretica]